jgi:hypothetical protein
VSVQRGFGIAVPVLFGMWSMLLGADGNWDLYNYHLYNPHAWLNGKLAIDFAPAGLQSFFNPLLDVPYYLAFTHLPPRLTAFLMGALHGMNFILLAGICRRVLDPLPGEEARRVPLLLALCGMLTANFLAQLGNTMGDNTTALFVLGAMLLVLDAWPRLASGDPPWLVLAAAGLLAGLGTGLKLTNAVHALALCAGLLTVPAPMATRLRGALVFGAAVGAGTAIAAGPWWHAMWAMYGNPLFPQFAAVFSSPLSSSAGVADTTWLPRNAGERFLWPFLISLDARRAGQLPLRQGIWALVYVLAIAAIAVAWLRGRRSGVSPASMPPASRFVVVVLGVSFVLWMAIFGIYRYLVPMELLAPLAAYVLLRYLLAPETARRAAAWALGACTLLVLSSGPKTWDQNPWGERAFAIDVPPLAQPATTTSLIVGGDPPWAWLAIGFPREVAFTQLGGNFPAGPAFAPRVRELVASRGGPVYAVVNAHVDAGAERGGRTRAVVEALGLTGGPTGCSILRRISGPLRLRGEIAARGQACEFVPERPAPRDIEAENSRERERASAILAGYGFALSGEACSTHRAAIAGGIRAFQWCPVSGPLPGR